MRPQPVFDNLPPHSLFRPAVLPADVDLRLDQNSIWMTVDEQTSRAVYWITPTCLCCKHPAFAQHCDRGWPACARCTSRGINCLPGKQWGNLRAKSRRRNTASFVPAPRATTSRSVRLSNAAKLAIEAAESASVAASTEVAKSSMPKSISRPQATSTLDTGMANDKKENCTKSYESATLPLAVPSEIPPPVVSNSTVTALPPAVVPLPSPNKRPHTTFASPSSKNEVPVKRSRQKVSVPKSVTVPSSDDELYFARLKANGLKPPLLSSTYGACPVWAKTRRGLQAALEYFRELKRTSGASVDISGGGVARGVLLEGSVEAQGVFWGEGERMGTIITSIGYPRRQKPITSQEDEVASVPPEPSLSTLSATVSTSFAESSKPGKRESESAHDELPEVKALLKAQRARTPVALAVAQDFDSIPFRVTEPFIVLGWFWVVESWLEPVLTSLELFKPIQKAPSGPPEKVVWKFRFEYCNGSQPPPWWSTPSQQSVQQGETSISTTETLESQLPVGSSWDFIGPSNTNEADTVKSPVVLDEPNGHVEIYRSEEDKKYTHQCENCRKISHKVYADGDICLNESCSWFFGDASDPSNRIGPIRNEPGPLQDIPHILPEQLNLVLVPPEPSIHMLKAGRENAGREYWTGFVCNKCKLAQERDDWSGWRCKLCDHFVIKSGFHSHISLRPFRPICTGPRQEDGFAIWPKPTRRSWSLYEDNAKVIRHQVDASLGPGTEVHHVLGSERQADLTGKLFMELQKLGSVASVAGDVNLPKRYPTLSDEEVRRPAESFLSPFYTFLAGNDAPPLPGFPTGPIVRWKACPKTFVDVMHIINFQAGRMFPGRPQFSNLTMAAYPPQLLTSQHPPITVPPNSYIAIMFLGSDCIVRFRPANTRTKPGEITVQHGDLIGVQTGSEPTNVSLKTGSFGIICIARHGGIHAGSQNQTQVKFESPLESGPVPAQIIEKPALLPEVPLTDWYIGGLPLEPSQPTIVLPPFRAERPKPVWAPNGDATNGEGGEENSQENNEEQAANQNIIILTTPPPTPRLREPRGLSPLAGYGESTASLRRSLAVPSPPPVTAKRVGKATRGRASTGSSVPDDRRSSTPMRGGKRASIGKRKAKAEPGASDAEAEDEMSNSGEPKEEDGEGGGKRRKNVGGRRSLGTPTTTRGRGGGRGRGGRKSAVV
ncbi:hypothetical protein I314_05423 [Cryptococcus bacillisporus CA1873]|uniref:Uncharacterized protein n=1 Tax=Cryptococcus bacillisporus CA1873 TaxID=1296111 RepID=A0ABR5B4T7_CRYGA|nr:hypothetical protein I314_05423 [Cryptococcus bacillisporus CA1873]|eukprot:KIR58584.1 hypothetical protein I314_05423 [Cryptococcus gattii CA1873]